MDIDCVRCGGPCEPVDVGPKVTHYRCSDDDCRPPHPLYQDERPLTFWAGFTAEVGLALAYLPVALSKKAYRWVRP